MLKRRALWLVIVVLAMATGSAFAGDVGGKWVAEFTTPDGQTRESTFNFQVEGEKLTGTVSGRQGDTPIENGKISGDEISFSVTRNWGQGDVKFRYEGTLGDEQIHLKVTIEGRDRTFDMTAKRVQD